MIAITFCFWRSSYFTFIVIKSPLFSDVLSRETHIHHTGRFYFVKVQFSFSIGMLNCNAIEEFHFRKQREVQMMEKNDNKDVIQNEKNKLHIKYLIAIASVISIGSIVLSLCNKDTFVAQVSFASTITSIVLSVIAIWMSISSERTTNDIKSKIWESTERLAKTTENVEILNDRNESIMNTQLNELNDVKEKLEAIIHSVDTVGGAGNNYARKGQCSAKYSPNYKQ